MKVTQTTIRLPVELKEKLQQEADRKGYNELRFAKQETVTPDEVL